MSSTKQQRDMERGDLIGYTIVAIGVVLAIGFALVYAGTEIGKRAAAQTARQPFPCTETYSPTRPMCPPDSNRSVLATWQNGLTTQARWTGREWAFNGWIFNQRGTTEHPLYWAELE